MQSFRSLALLGLAATTLAEPRVLHMPIARNPDANRLAKRDHAQVTVTNAKSQGLYFVNATVGTPGQEVQLVLDTGSSDVWFFGPNSCNSQTSDCLGGIFDPSKSSTIETISSPGAFVIQYGTPGSNVTGTYIKDDFKVGGASLTNLTMAYATYAAFVPTGVMGIGFDTNEAITETGSKPYQNFIDVLVSENVISTKAYSLWLNDLDSSTGSCLFGGYDTKKFSGNLLTVDIQPDEQSGALTSMTVAWTSLAVTTSSGTKQVTSSNFVSPALLDSGTTMTVIPNDIYQELLDFFQIASNQQGDAIVDCKLLDSSEGSLDFTFGAADGPVIKVPFSELALPAIGTDGSWLTLQDGSLACVLGLQPNVDSESGSELPIIFGDTFLRSAYVVYDLDNKQISLAQTVFNETDSNIVEISSTTPIASVVTGASVTQTATGNPNVFGGVTATGGISPTGSSSGINSIGVLGSTGSSTSSATSSSKASSASLPTPAPGFMSTLLIAGASMMLGSVFFIMH